MDMEPFEGIKFAALSNAKRINQYVKNVTIGPNRTLIEDDEPVTLNTNPCKPSKVILRRPQPLNNTNAVINELHYELKKQRQDKVKEAINKHVDHFKKFSEKQDIETKQRILLQQQLLQNRVQQQELIILNALEQHDKDMSAQHQQLVQYYKELAERKRRNDLELQEKEKRKQQINLILDRLSTDQIEFRHTYQEISNTLKNCKYLNQLKAVLGDTIKNFTAMPASMAEIITQCKNGVISEADCHKTSNLVQEIKGVLELVKQKILEVNEAEEKRAKVPDPVVPSQPEPTLSANTITSLNQPSTESMEIQKFVSKPSLKLYTELQSFMNMFESSLVDFLNNDTLKQFRFDCKKAVNIPVNAISATNTHHLTDKYDRLSKLLNGSVVEVGGSRVCAANHPQGVAYCKSLLANNFVLQGDLMISSKPEAAFSYSAVIVALWNEQPDFGKLLLAQFHSVCPYLVPIYPPRTREQTDEEFYRSQGYKYMDGIVEKQDKFLKRMTGTMSLYAAIIITHCKKGQTKNPLSLNEGWRWLAAFVNLEPKHDITATMLHAFLETAGSTLETVYGKAFKKLMIYIYQTYLPIIQKLGSGGPITRLELLLQNYLKTGHFEAPSGLLANNFW